MNLKEEILEVLCDVRPDVDFEKEKQLITGGILDSFDIVTLVGEFNDAFDVEIRVQNLIPDNFNSIEGMVSLISKLQDEE